MSFLWLLFASFRRPTIKLDASEVGYLPERFHAEISNLTASLAELEEEWLELSSELESA